MAEEPSWEDIFNPNPTPRQPAAPAPIPPLVEPQQAYPPTQAYPVQPDLPMPAAQPQAPSQEDPFAALFATPQPAAPQPASPAYPPQAAAPAAPAPQPVAAEDPFAALFSGQPPAAAQPTTAPGQYPQAQQYTPLPPMDASVQEAAAFASELPPAPAPAPAQQYPAAQALPPAAPAAPTSDDPLAGLFGNAQPAGAAAAPPAHEFTPEPPFPTTATARFTPREEDDPFAALFGASAAAAPEVAAPQRSSDFGGEQPSSRREARGDAARTGGGRGGRGGSEGDGFGGGAGGGASGGAPKKKRRLLWLKITLPIVLVLAAAGGVGAYGWFNYNTQVRALLGIPLPTDYTGDGNGTEVIVTIKAGDIGEDVARTLHDKGVTLTFNAFYKLLLAQKDQPEFQPGNFRLQQHMSAAAALAALLNPDNKVTDKLLITEGSTLSGTLQTIADTTGIALADLQAASKDLAALGVPATEPSLEGYLFPATYQLDSGLTAHDVLKLLVDTMYEHLDAAGVPVDQRHNVLTLASIIQRESGPNTDDFYKISRVFTNRIEQGINLESDATVAYGTGNLHTVYTTDAERADASNKYNTYANPGLPIGPIGLPGDLAIDAALHPADGPWLFFVPINLQTGETVFSETVDEHDAAVQKLHDWCAASPENDSYCK